MAGRNDQDAVLELRDEIFALLQAELSAVDQRMHELAGRLAKLENQELKQVKPQDSQGR